MKCLSSARQRREREIALDQWGVSEGAAKLHTDAIVWDNIFPYFDYYFFSQTMSGAQAGLFDPKYAALKQYRESGCSFLGLTISGARSNVTETMRIIATNRSFFRAHTDEYQIVAKADDVLAAKRDGKMAVGFNFQGSDSLEGNIDMVHLYYEL